MYQSLRIQRFRCFRDFAIDNLALVNLIAGRNSVGKTTFLEALFLHCGAANPELALRLGVFRGMDLAYSVPGSGQPPWATLFHNLDQEAAIEITGVDVDGNARSLSLSQSVNGGSVHPTPRVSDSLQTSQTSVATTQPSAWCLKLGVDEGRNRGYKEYKLLLRKDGPQVDDVPSPPFSTVFVLSGRRHGGTDDVQRFSRLSIERRTEPVVEAMKIIEPRLKDLSVNVLLGTPVVYADIGLPELLPVQVLGDGVSRVLALMTSIASCPRGVVLIDEAETGFHHSMFRPLWQAIMDLAHRLDVQLFAATHSHEFLAAARDAARGFTHPILRLHRLDRVHDDIEAVTYDDEALDGAIAADLEVR